MRGRQASEAVREPTISGNSGRWGVYLRDVYEDGGSKGLSSDNLKTKEWGTIRTGALLRQSPFEMTPSSHISQHPPRSLLAPDRWPKVNKTHRLEPARSIGGMISGSRTLPSLRHMARGGGLGDLADLEFDWRALKVLARR